ncbi:MAG: PmoA family protein [Planctomycetota bacterium]
MTELNFEVSAGKRPVSFCPVSVEVEESAEDLKERALIDQQRGTPIPFQVEDMGEDGARVHWIIDRMAAGQKREFTVSARHAPVDGPVVAVQDEGDRMRVKAGGEILTNYHYGDQVPRPCLYPVIGPYGDGVTRAYPMEIVEDDHTDHPHHRSVWSAWGDVNGSDNWSEEDHAGTVEHSGFRSYGGGHVYGWIESANDWLDVEGQKLMEDRMVWRFYNLPGGSRLMELEIEFLASEGDVLFGDTKEGGICSVRVSAPMEVDRGGRIENGYGGIDEPETWGKRAPWCDYSGIVNGNRVGISVFDHPDNLRYPTYWHVRNYGLMTANPFGLSYFLDSENADGSYTLPEGESLEFRYAIYIHAGDAGEGEVGSRYLDWIYPPGIEVQ